MRENVICMLFEREFSHSIYGEVIKYFLLLLQNPSIMFEYFNIENKVIKREL